MNKRIAVRVSLWLACTALIWFMSSCEEDCIYHHYKSTGKGGWRNQDTLIFDIPITDTTATYCVNLEVRNNLTYKYREVYLMTEVSFLHRSRTTAISSDLICYPLTTKDGEWSGSGWGSILQSSRPLRLIHFKNSGTLHYKVYHKMNTPLLQGIPDIGLKVAKRGATD